LILHFKRLERVEREPDDFVDRRGHSMRTTFKENSPRTGADTYLDLSVSGSGFFPLF
jgi:hypothetical protein